MSKYILPIIRFDPRPPTPSKTAVIRGLSKYTWWCFGRGVLDAALKNVQKNYDFALKGIGRGLWC